MKEKQHGSFYGLGIQIQKRMGKITVIAPMEGTPAYKMGIRAGDVITHIDEEELKEDTTTEDVVRKLRGPKGTDGRDHDPPRRLRRADPHDDHARRDPDPLRPLRLHARAGRGLHHAVRLHPHLEQGALRRHPEAREAGHEEAPARPARQPRRRPRAGRRRHRRLRAQGLDGRLHARAARRRRPRSTTRRATARTSTTPSSCWSTGARPRPPRSWPARSRTTTAASSSGSARGARASSRASTPSPTAPASP